MFEMTSTRPDVVLEAKHSVAETAKLLGVHRCTVHGIDFGVKPLFEGLGRAAHCEGGQKPGKDLFSHDTNVL